MIIASKLGAAAGVAQVRPAEAAVLASARAAASGVASGAPSSAALPSSSAMPPSVPDLGAKAKDDEDTVNSTLGDTVIEDARDLTGLSQEQVDAIGNGKVPIHLRGATARRWPTRRWAARPRSRSAS